MNGHPSEKGNVSVSPREELNEQAGLCPFLEILSGLSWRMLGAAVVSAGWAESLMSHK